MKNKLILFAVSAMLVLGLAGGAFAEAGDNGGNGNDIVYIDVYHHYYIPFMTGADNCYGAYRIVSSRGHGDNFLSVGEDTLTTSSYDLKRLGEGYKKPAQPKSQGWSVGNYTQSVNFTPDLKTKPVVITRATYLDSRTVRRDDVTVLTDFAIVDEAPPEYDYQGNICYIHHRFYHYETPQTVLGEVVDMNPIYGSVIWKLNQGTEQIALSRREILTYFQGVGNEADFSKFLLPGYVGINARSYGKIVKQKQIKPYHFFYILSMNETQPEAIGWWEMFTEPTLQYIRLIRDEIAGKRPAYYIDKSFDYGSAILSQLKKEAEDAKKKGGDYAGANATAKLMEMINSAANASMTPDILSMYFHTSLSLSLSPYALFRFDKPFLDSWDMYSLWRKKMQDMEDEIWRIEEKKLGIDGQKETAEALRSIARKRGFSVGGSFEVPAPELIPYNGEPREVVVRTMFTDSSFLNSYIGNYPGNWTHPLSSDDDHYSRNMMMYVTNSPSDLARWIYAGAQNSLYTSRKSSIRTLSNWKGDTWRPVLQKRYAATPTGNLLRAEIYTGLARSGNLAGNHPVGTVVPDSYWEEPWIPAKESPAPQDGNWQKWWNKDRLFYSAVIPYLSGELGLLFSSQPDNIVYWSMAKTKIFKPELLYGMKTSTENAPIHLTANPKDAAKDIPGIGWNTSVGLVKGEGMKEIYRNSKRISASLPQEPTKLTLKTSTAEHGVIKGYLHKAPVDSEKYEIWAKTVYSKHLGTKLVELPDRTDHKLVWAVFPKEKLGNGDVKGIPPNWKTVR